MPRPRKKRKYTRRAAPEASFAERLASAQAEAQEIEAASTALEARLSAWSETVAALARAKRAEENSRGDVLTSEAISEGRYSTHNFFAQTLGKRL